MAEIDSAEAAEVFRRYAELCEGDAGALWGQSLCHPMVLVDPQSRAAAANAAPPVEGFAGHGPIHLGQFPANGAIANTALDWERERWVQLVWPVTGDPLERSILLAHEAFHGSQPALGVTVREGDNGHLDSEDGRLWLRLEMQALAEAVRQEEHWQTAAQDALAFRKHRLHLFPTAADDEAALISNEGLAEYTGVVIGAADDKIETAVARLTGAEERESFVRSLGYMVGPAYGLLLDRFGDGWREAALGGAALPLLLEASLAAESDELERRASRYDYPRIANEERTRAEIRAARTAELVANFVDGAVLIVPLRAMNIGFDPNRVFALEDEGTVYTGARIDDVWGVLEADGDVLMSPGWDKVRLPLAGTPAGSDLSGPGWRIALAENWQIAPGEREGDFTLTER